MKKFSLELHGNRREDKFLPTIEIPFKAPDAEVAQEFFELVYEVFSNKESFYENFNCEMYLLDGEEEYLCTLKKL